MKRLRNGRNNIARILVIIGIALLLFAILWWVLAVKRLVRYPSGVDLSVVAKGSVERLAGTHGLLKYDPARKAAIELKSNLASVDDEYTSGTAVVAELTTCGSGDLPGGLDLDDENTYVMDRGDCINRKSRLSNSSGSAVDRAGSWSVNFPLGTDRKSYNLFNNDVASSFAVNFVREDTVNGVRVYVFEGSFRHRPVVDYRARAMGLPDSTTYGDIKKELAEGGIPIDTMIRAASGSLTEQEKEIIDSFPDNQAVGLDYTVKCSWEAAVEPVTGTIVDVRRDETSIFVNTDVKTFLPLFEILASHAEDPQVVRYLSQLDQQKVLEPKEIYRIVSSYTRESATRMTDYANGRIGPIRFVKDYMTYLFLILGTVLVVGGLALRRERQAHRTARGGGPEAETEEDTGAP